MEPQLKMAHAYEHLAERQARARAWFEELRDRVCASLEAIEDEIGECAGR